MKYVAELCRVFKTEKQTLGQIDVVATDMLGNSFIAFTCFSLELPDLNNAKQISCIIEGTYRLRKENHSKFGWCYRLYDVPNRDGVLIHGGTYFTHTHGCILPATSQKDLNKDGSLDNVESKKALAKLIEFDLTSIKIWTRP